ncbi:ABC transporter ATP-binding protein [Blautia marasmi]|uniref:ABC transporter ATP-binding protein n=1 Tax=Blautia marasmi TaxID=1917868 RepID=UPI00266CDDCE|nr:ABC transporter ATP-binding protein [Blautia marasmi]
MEHLLYGKEIVKSYGEGREEHIVLDGVSLEIEKGEFVSVMGPSGSGKSTLLYTLSGMDPAYSGSVVFDGCRLSGLKEDALSDLRRNKMGFVFQQPAFLKNLNLLDNIILPAMRDNHRNVRAVTLKAKNLMKKVGIEELEERDITQVSGGQLQRAGICRALMSEPDIIFGDEPTGALNSKSAQEIMALLKEINAEGTAVLVVTHDAKVAAKTRRVLFMQDGKIVSELRFENEKTENYDKREDIIMKRMQQIGI